MALIIPNPKWESPETLRGKEKPLSPVRLKLADPITNGLGYAFVFTNSQRDTLEGSKWRYTNPREIFGTVAPGPGGMGLTLKNEFATGLFVDTDTNFRQTSLIDVTLEAFVSFAAFDTGEGQGICTYWGDTTIGRVWRLEANSGGTQLTIRWNNTASRHDYNATLEVNRVYHVAAVFTRGSSNFKGLYVDGQLASGANEAPNNLNAGGDQSEHFVIGARSESKDTGGSGPYDTSDMLNGTIYQCNVWERVLSASEIARRYRDPWGHVELE